MARMDEKFAAVIFSTMKTTGWQVEIVGAKELNPLHVVFKREEEILPVIFYARPLTHQQGKNTTHNRPAGELHTQMIFDGSQRGAGVRNSLRFEDDSLTVLFGFYEFTGNEYVIVAYDPRFHQDYAYSKSLQSKITIVHNARNIGMSQYKRNNNELVVAFNITEIEAYLLNAEILHYLENYSENQQNLSEKARQSLFTEKPLPELRPSERRQLVQEITRYVRDTNFSRGIRTAYERCAICGFQYNDVLDAAHIIPVADGGNDTYQNGLGLCPNCHRMYDKGFILVDGNYTIHINTRHAENLQAMNKADSLDNLQATLRKTIWIPVDKKYQPAAKYLQKTFDKPGQLHLTLEHQ